MKLTLYKTRKHYTLTCLAGHLHVGLILINDGNMGLLIMAKIHLTTDYFLYIKLITFMSN